jgi:bifunctional DNase/RNase
MLEEWEFGEAAHFGNFRALRKNPRFRELVGEIGGEHQDLLGSLQLRFLISTRPRSLSKSPHQEKEYEASLPRPTKALLGQLKRVLDEGALTALEGIRGPKFEERKRAKVSLSSSSGRNVDLALGEVEASMMGLLMMGAQLPRPLTHDLFCNVLEAIGIRIECAVLTKRRRWGIEAGLLVKRDRQRELVSLGAAGALTVALRVGCPVMIAESLAQKLNPKQRTAKSC